MPSRPVAPNRFWWIHPGKLLLFFLVPIYALVIGVVPQTSPQLLVLNAALYARGPYALYGLLVLVATGVCALVGGRIDIDGRQEACSIRVSARLLFACGSIAILAYAIWFYPAVLRGNFSAGDRANMNHTPGVTSFTQLAVPFMIAYVSGLLLEQADFGSAVRLQFKLLVFLTLARVYLWSERLALIEAVVPIAILVFTHRPPRSTFGNWAYRILGAFGPFLAVPLLLGMFTLTEFFRSWTTYSETQSEPILDFMTARLTTYYFTAINNGIGMLLTQEGRWPTYDVKYTLEWLYRLPMGVGHIATQQAVSSGDSNGEFLNRFADVEFNNMSGIFPIVYDLGLVGALLYFCAFGFLAGGLYRSMLHGRILGITFFPSVFVGCIEIMRITYVNGPRYLLIFVGGLTAYISVRAAQTRYVRRIHGAAHRAH